MGIGAFFFRIILSPCFESRYISSTQGLWRGEDRDPQSDERRDEALVILFCKDRL
jgi:hypothetical protein